MGTNATIDVERPADHIELERGSGAGGYGRGGAHDVSHATFVRWLLGAIVLGVGAIAAINWYVDPTGVTSRTTPYRIGENAEVRSSKLDLYEQRLAAGMAPEVVLLGSSRTMKFEPAHVEQLTGRPAFNAAVSGGVPRDAWLFTQLIEERQAEEFPHLVWGLDVDAFRDKQLRAGLSTDPRMSRFVPPRERLTSYVAAAGTLTELQTLKATIRAVQAGGTTEQERLGALRRRWAPDGFQRWALVHPDEEPELERAIRRQMAGYVGFIFERDAYTGIEPEPLEEFRSVIRTANEHGDEPTIFLTPYHPVADEILERYDMAAREREVRELLDRLQAEGDLRFQVADLSELDSFGGDPAQFYDGIHMTPANTRRALERLHAEDLLAP